MTKDNPAKACARDDCPGKTMKGFTLGYGLLGGGVGVYEYCDLCNKLISKTEDES